MFIDSQSTLDYDSQITDKYFTEYTGIKVKQFRDTLLQHMSNVKKSVAKRTRHQRQYDKRVNKRQMQTQESKIDMGKGIDAHSVVTESSGTESEVQDDNNRSGNDTDADDPDIRPIYNEEPLAEVQLTAECNIFAIGQQHTKEPEIINEGQHGQILNETSNKAKIKKEIDVLETINIKLEHSVANFRKENETLKKHYKDLKLKGNIVDTKFAKTSVLGKPVVQSPRNQSVVRQPDTFKSERRKMSKQRFASRVDVNNNLSRPITQHYLPKRSESDFAEPDHLIASNESRNRFQSTTDGRKPKPRSNNQTSRSLPVSKSSRVMIMAIPKADHSKSSTSFSDSKYFFCSTCHKCVFNANHDACITKLLKEVNLHAKIQSHKTRNNNKPVEQKSHTQKPGMKIFTGHRFSPNNTCDVYEKTSPRSDLRWKPTGRIFQSVGLRWIPTRKLFDSCTSKVDSELPNGSNVYIPNIHECKQTLNLSAELESIFGLLFDEYFSEENQVVSKSSAVTTADTSIKRQHTQDSTSSTSTLPTTVSADGNFDL
nr:hypothetical protein [Tanacetum cinerariifolium]